MRSRSRRTFLKTASAVSAGSIATLAGCQTAGIPGGGSGNGTKSLNLGGMMPLSGPFASVGEPIRDGIDFAVKEINNADNDMEMSVTHADTEASPDTAVKRARELVQQNDVDVLLGFAASSTANAVAEFGASQNVPVLNTTSQSETLTGENCRKQAFTTTTNVSQLTKAVSKTVADVTEEGTQIAGIIPDYSFGHATWDYFTESIKSDANAEIVAETFPSFGQGDFQNEIQAVLDADPDVIYTTVWAGDLITLIQQGKQYDMFEQVPEFVHGGGSIIDVSRALGDDMIEMMAATAYFYKYPDTDRNKQFVKAWRDEYDGIPTGAAQEGYAGTYAIKNAIEGADNVNSENLISGLEGLEFEAPEGTKKIRAEDHACIEESIWVGRVGPIDDLDVYGFSEMMPTSGESVTKEPNCEF